MVRRTVNFRELDVDGSRSLGDVVEIPGKAQVIATDPDGKTVVLTREQAKKVKTGDYGNYIINQEPVKRGSVKTDYLFQDLSLSNEMSGRSRRVKFRKPLNSRKGGKRRQMEESNELRRGQLRRHGVKKGTCTCNNKTQVVNRSVI